MATYSAFLGLKLDDGSDPFLLSDFLANWAILDGSPGTYVCTSASKPSWGAAQAGRQIFMTDYRQVLWWTGTTWADPEDSVPVVAGGVVLNQSISRSSSLNSTVVTLTLSRSCALAIILTATYSGGAQFISQSILMDGTALSMGSYLDDTDIEVTNSVGGISQVTIPSVAVAPGLVPGTHRIGVQSSMGANNVTAAIRGARLLAFVASYNSSNTM